MEREKAFSVWWLRGIATLLGLTPPAVVLLLQSSLEAYLSTVSPGGLVKGTAILLLTIGLLAALLVLQRPWLKWDEPTGTWVSRFDGIRYCEKCKVDKKAITPLKNEITGWRCMSCERWYADPARKPKEKPTKAPPKRERI